MIFGQRSRMDERYDLQRAARDERFLYIRNYMPHRPYGQNMGYMWQQRGYQDWEQAHLDGDVTPLQEAFWDEKAAEELYDLERDPGPDRQPRRRAARHADELRRLRRALDEHLLETNDNGFIPEGSPLEGHDESRAPGAYPIRRVLRVAETAIERDPANLDALVARPRRRQRGRALLGRAGPPDARRRGASRRSRRSTRALAADPSPQVRIVAAEALARLGHTGRPVKFLIETLDTHENIRVRLLAINALTYVGVAALPYMPVIERAANSTDEYIRNAGRYLRFVLTGTYTPASRVFP